MQTLRSSGDNSSNWVFATHLRPLDWVPGAQAPQLWAFVEWSSTWELFLSLKVGGMGALEVSSMDGITCHVTSPHWLLRSSVEELTQSNHVSLEITLCFWTLFLVIALLQHNSSSKIHLSEVHNSLVCSIFKVVQPSPLSNFRTFSSLQKETLCWCLKYKSSHLDWKLPDVSYK